MIHVALSAALSVSRTERLGAQEWETSELLGNSRQPYIRQECTCIHVYIYIYIYPISVCVSCCNSLGFAILIVKLEV